MVADIFVILEPIQRLGHCIGIRRTKADGVMDQPAERHGSGDYYRERAQDMLRQAEQAATDEARAQLLKLADQWHRLAQKVEQPNW